MTIDNKAQNVKFYDALEKSLKKRRRKLKDLCDSEDTLGKRILEDYGAVFLARDVVLSPAAWMFADAESVDRFQIRAGLSAADFDGAKIELQPAAMQALLKARREAQDCGANITPRGGAEAARRSFADTLRLWDSRVFPALVHWTKAGRITPDEAEQLKMLPLREQIAAVLKLEKQNIFFSKDFSKSILYSVAAPGCSQHLSLLAFDANEFQDERVRQILGRHGWFRTVQNDLPHFTFVGYEEDELPALGLLKLETADGEFWIPNV